MNSVRESRSILGRVGTCTRVVMNGLVKWWVSGELGMARDGAWHAKKLELHLGWLERCWDGWGCIGGSGSGHLELGVGLEKYFFGLASCHRCRVGVVSVEVVEWLLKGRWDGWEV